MYTNVLIFQIRTDNPPQNQRIIPEEQNDEIIISRREAWESGGGGLIDEAPGTSCYQ